MMIVMMNDDGADRSFQSTLPQVMHFIGEQPRLHGRFGEIERGR
jgi:hypothetical protein